MRVIWYTNQHIPNKNPVKILTFHVLENFVLQSVKSGMHMNVDVKNWKLLKFFYFVLLRADVPNALKLPLCILSLNTIGYGCKKSASLTRLYETASLLYVPSKSYIFQPQQYKNLLQQAYNLSLNEESGKMNLAIRVNLNQNWREQDKKRDWASHQRYIHIHNCLSAACSLEKNKERFTPGTGHAFTETSTPWAT